MIYIDGIIYSLQKGGGISVYFSEIIKRLINKQTNCNIVVHNTNNVLNEYGQEVFISKRFYSKYLSILRYLDVFIGSNISVFHSSYYRLPLFFQRNKVKIVTTVHDFTYEKYSSGMKKYIHHWQKKRAIINSDVIICISNNTKADLLDYIPEAKEKNIVVIYNGVSDDYYKLSTVQNNVTNNIIFVGARSGYKNFDILVKALKVVVDKNLIIVGGGALTESEIHLLNENIKGRYQYKSFVSNKELNVLYNNAYCLIYPSLYEGFGIPAIEAMKAGCPVIASNSSSLPEVCGNAAILLDEVTEVSLLNAIELLSNNKVRNELILNGFINAERFSWDNTFKELEKIYLEEK